jgi:hypothetical protein
VELPFRIKFSLRKEGYGYLKLATPLGEIGRKTTCFSRQMKIKKSKVEFIKMVTKIKIVEFKRTFIKNTKYKSRKLKELHFAVCFRYQ